MENGVCLSCKDGAVLYGKNCYIANCNFLDANGLCQRCFVGYVVTNNGTKCEINYQDQNCLHKNSSTCL